MRIIVPKWGNSRVLTKYQKSEFQQLKLNGMLCERFKKHNTV